MKSLIIRYYHKYSTYDNTSRYTRRYTTQKPFFLQPLQVRFVHQVIVCDVITNINAGKLRRLSCSQDDLIYFLPVAATSLRAGFQVYLSKLWVVDVTKEVRYDLLIYCLLSDVILYFVLVSATSLRAGFQVYLS